MNFRDIKLDRIPQFDPRSRAFAAVSGIEDRPLRSYTWACDTFNDQGREGACVGFAWSHELAAKPKVIPTDNEFALRVYRRAQFLDPWEGEDYDGTSVLAGVKAVQEIKNSRGNPLIREYRWAFGIEDVARVLSWRGPLVLGINWHDSMYDPDENHFISPTGDYVGGHAIVANGIKIVKRAPGEYPVLWENVDINKSYVRLHNSWGQSYGLNGDAFMTLADLSDLLEVGGEACIPTLRAYA